MKLVLTSSIVATMSADPRLSRDPRKAATAVTPQPPPPPPVDSSQQGVTISTEAKPTNGVEKHEEENVDKFALRFCTVCASNQNR